MFYCHLLLVVMCGVKYDRDLFCWQCFCNYTIVFFLAFLSGHGKFETLGSLGISCMLLLTAGGIAWHALEILLV